MKYTKSEPKKKTVSDFDPDHPDNQVPFEFDEKTEAAPVSVQEPEPEPEIPPQNLFLTSVWKGQNVFLSGQAGTGKSFLLRELRNSISDPILYTAEGETWPDGTWKPSPMDFEDKPRSMAVTAPTGIAAVNVQGTTIHKWAGVLLGPEDGESFRDCMWRLNNSPYPSVASGVDRIEDAELLVIDEISMVPGRLFDFLDYYFKKLRHSSDPFGGIQVVVIGDFMQLPPVRKNEDKPYDWAFNTAAWRNAGFREIMLDKVYRQTGDDLLLPILTDIRYGKLQGELLDALGSRVTKNPGRDIPRLFTHNSMVDKWNNALLSEIDAPETLFQATRYGDREIADFVMRNMVTPEMLKLKVGARVMATRNDSDNRWVNGSMGRVTDIICGTVLVEWDDGTEDMVQKVEFSDSKNKGGVLQLPLKLGWAVTIHKSQGMTLDKAYIDIRAAREPGQAYVALSRLRSLEGLHLKGWPKGFRVSNDAIGYYDEFGRIDRYDQYTNCNY